MFHISSSDAAQTSLRVQVRASRPQTWMRLFQGLCALFAACVLVFGISACQNAGSSSNDSSQSEQTTTANTNDANKASDIKVVAGTVSVAQILDKLGYKNVVGVPETQYDLGSYTDIQKIGLSPSPDVEVIKSLNPDLFISVESFKESLQKTIEDLGIKSMFVDLGTYDAVLNSIKEIGEATGETSASDKLVSDIEAQANTAVEKSEGKTAPKVLYLFATPKSAMAGSSSSFVGSLIAKLGATNIAPEGGEAYTALSMENVVTENPDIIVITSHGDPTAAKEMMQSTFDNDPAWQSTNAFKNDKVVYLPDDLFNVSGNVRVGEALDQLAGILYE